MGLPLLVSADPANLSSPSPAGLTLKQVSFFGRVLIKSTSIEQSLSFIKANFSLLDIYVDATAITSVSDIVDLLNEGTTKALVTISQLIQISEKQTIPPWRLIVVLLSTDDATSLKTWIAETKEARNAISVLNETISPIDTKELGLSEGSETFRRYQTVAELPDKEANYPIIPSTVLSLDKEDGFPIKLLTANAVADSGNGLYATIVTNEREISLGLVWSSETSLLESLRTGTGVYQSRKRGLWYKGASSGDTQELVRIDFDCDSDCLQFVVRQKGRGFCHLARATCFGEYKGLSQLESTLQARKADAPQGSYTARLFSNSKLLEAKILEEAEELCQGNTNENIAFETADLFYFALTKCVASGVSLADVERSLDLKSLKLKRRAGNAKDQWARKVQDTPKIPEEKPSPAKETPKVKNNRIEMPRVITSQASTADIEASLQRPAQKSNDAIVAVVKPIIDNVRQNGDAAVLEYTHKFEKATSLTSPVLKAPFPDVLMSVSTETKQAIDVSYDNIRRFHAAQKEEKPLTVATMPGVVCSRFARAIERVGLYIPGGTAVLPSTALMLGVPAMVAGCKKIVFASPPRSDGSISPEIVYIAHKVGAESIVLAGGAQAVAAMAYGTESTTKVDKILGPGNQFVTAAKMVVANDTSATIGIDMPAGPSEVLVIADKHANPAFVASDLLSQAEHGVDSQVVLIAVDLDEKHIVAIEEELNTQANALPRVDIVRGAISHSVTLVVSDINEAMKLSNAYAPEHLILQIQAPESALGLVENAGSVFVGPWTPESVGDYSAGVNHSLPTYGYAKQYSGVNLASFVKHITSSSLTVDGLRNVSTAVMQLASVEGLDAHHRAVSIRMEHLDGTA